MPAKLQAATHCEDRAANMFGSKESTQRELPCLILSSHIHTIQYSAHRPSTPSGWSTAWVAGELNEAPAIMSDCSKLAWLNRCLAHASKHLTGPLFVPCGVSKGCCLAACPVKYHLPPMVQHVQQKSRLLPGRVTKLGTLGIGVRELCWHPFKNRELQCCEGNQTPVESVQTVLKDMLGSACTSAGTLPGPGVK